MADIVYEGGDGKDAAEEHLDNFIGQSGKMATDFGACQDIINLCEDFCTDEKLELTTLERVEAAMRTIGA